MHAKWKKVVITSLFIGPITTFAHLGRRDSYNGHIAHKAGCSYHCHDKQKCGKIFCLEDKCEAKQFYNKKGRSHTVQEVKDPFHLPQDIRNRIDRCKAMQVAIQLMNTSEAPQPTQNREEFQKSIKALDSASDTNKNSGESLPKYNAKSYKFWSDFNDDCKDTRAELLIDFSWSPVTFTNDSKCKVKTGHWTCPYSGRKYTYARDIHIDHVVSRGEAHVSGSAYWSAEKKELFANDKDNLIPVAGSANMEKGAKDPSRWLPEVEENICAYIDRWVYVKKKWNLTMDEEEAQVVSQIQSTCPKEEPSFTMVGFPGTVETAIGDDTDKNFSTSHTTKSLQTLLEGRDKPPTVILKCDCLVFEKNQHSKDSHTGDWGSYTKKVKVTTDKILIALNSAFKACNDLELENPETIKAELTYCSEFNIQQE